MRLGSGIDLYKLAKAKSDCAEYHPELYISLHYTCKVGERLKKFTVTHKGRIFSTGFKSIEEMENGFKIIYEEILPHLKHSRKDIELRKF